MLKNLLKIRFSAYLGALFGSSKNGKRQGKGKIILFSALMLYVIAAFAFMSGGFAYLVAPTMIALEMDWLLFTLFNLAALTCIFIISIFETKSALFECRDNELLTSMPILPRDIVLSRLLWVLLVNLGMGVLLMLPMLIVYAVVGGSVLAVVGGTLVMLILPVLATALSVGVGYIVARIAKLFKRKNLVTLLFSLAFLGAYFYVYARIMNATEMLEGDVGALLGGMSDKLSIFRALGEVSLLSPIPFVIFVALAVLASLGAYLFVVRNFFGIVTDAGKTKREEYKRSRLVRSTPFMALCRKEFARFFSSAIYMLNAAFGIIMELILAVFILVKSDMLLELAPAFSELLGVDLDVLLTSAASMVLLALAFTNSISASALSLEGHSFWILKSAPVSTFDLIHAKLMPHLVTTLPVGIISGVLLSLAVRADLLHAILITLTPILANIFMALFGLVINIAMPKFDYENEAVVVKQSGAMAVVALGGMLGGMLLAILGIYLTTLIGILAICLILTLLLLLSVVLYFVLIGPMGHRLEGMDI